MREETRLKFERQVRIERLKKASVAFGFALAIAAAVWLQNLDTQVTIKAAPGVIAKVEPYAGNSSVAIQQALMVDVRLADGREAHVMAHKDRHPEVGQHIELAEHVHGTGRSTFSWK